MSRLDRQSFLGVDSDAVLEAATIGIIGLGGGGSHIAQQAAHIGIGGYVNCDPQTIEHTNTNRLVGGTLADAEKQMPKTHIAERLIRGLQPNARIKSVQGDWRDAVDNLKFCDVIVGAVDSFKEREQLERFARRHLIPYIDIGMDVHNLGNGSFLIGGQIILSMPGCACLRCCGFITDDRLEQEAKLYGAAGSRPQVVWTNGVLASTAVGILTQILTPWFSNPPAFVYLEYDGNKGTVSRSIRMDMLKDAICPHHPPDETGNPLFDIRKHFATTQVGSAAPAHLPWRKRLWKEMMRAARRLFVRT
jgi:hypothetical protein